LTAHQRKGLQHDYQGTRLSSRLVQKDLQATAAAAAARTLCHAAAATAAEKEVSYQDTRLSSRLFQTNLQAAAAAAAANRENYLQDITV
jgi:hypothetical protein